MKSEIVLVIADDTRDVPAAVALHSTNMMLIKNITQNEGLGCEV